MKIVWSPEAVEDLVSLRAYIAEDSPATAQRTVRLIIARASSNCCQTIPEWAERDGCRAPANLSFRGHPTSCPIGSSEQRSKSCASIMRRDVGLTVFDRPLPGSSADRSIHSRGRSRLASRNRTPTPPPLSAMNATLLSTSQRFSQFCSKASSVTPFNTRRMRSIASTISARRGATISFGHQKISRAASSIRFFNQGMQTVARHDISLAAEDAGGTLLHVHQLEKTELAFFMIKKKVHVGIVPGLVTRRLSRTYRDVRRLTALSRLRAAAIGLWLRCVS